MAYLKQRKNCRWCKAVKADRKILKRIYASKKYTGRGETLIQIADAVGLPYHSLVNHCREHQFLTDDEASTRALENIARKTSRELVVQNAPTNNVRQEVINQIAQVLTSEDFENLDAQQKLDQLRRFAKDMDDVKAKQKDQNIDIMRMMASARSGEVFDEQGNRIEQFDPWKHVDAGL